MQSDVVVITGAHGFVGRHVAKAIARTGTYVIGIGHGNWASDEWRQWGIAEWHTADITVDSLTVYAKGPKAIVHCAGSGSVNFSMSNPMHDWQRNVSSTVAVLEYCRVHAPSCAVIYPSSAAVYGKAERLPIEVGDALNPTSPYGVHKMMGEDLCRSYARHFGVKASIVRLFSVYGLGVRKQLLWDACVKISSGNAQFGGTGLETRDWIHVEDAANLISIGRRHASESCPIVNGGTGIELTVRDVVSIIADRLSYKGELSFSGEARPGDPVHYCASIESAKAWGWAPSRDHVKEMNAYVEWYMRDSL